MSDSGRSHAHDSGRSHAHDSGRSHAQDSGRSHAQDSGRSHAQDSGRSHAQDSGRYHARGRGERHARDSGRGEPSGEPRNGDFQAAVARLERAVQELVVVARDRFSDRATAFIDETTERLEGELDRRSRPPRAIDERRYAEEPDGNVPRRLYRDRRRRKIGGVCAGIARYYGIEPWVVRIIAVTGLLFFPSIVFPAYWIAYFVMGKPPGRGRSERPRNGRHGRRDHRSPTPELGARLSPRYSLRNVQADLTEVELRLRRMETHVTSGQYELQRELHKIDRPA